MTENGIRLYIELPRRSRSAVIKDRDSIANLLIAAMSAHGYQPQPNTPARWGFGVVARSLGGVQPGQRLWAVERVVVGSSDPALIPILRAIEPRDLVEPNAIPGAGVDLRTAVIRVASPWPPVEAAGFYCVSPIRVTDRTAPDSGASYLETGPRLDELLNQTMQARFGRPFELRLIPDSLYVRSRHGNISAGMGIKTRANGKPVVIRGLLLPFVLVGSPQDIGAAWYSGLGRSTARGFGCLEMGQ